VVNLLQHGYFKLLGTGKLEHPRFLLNFSPKFSTLQLLPQFSTPPSAVVMDVPFATLGFRWMTNTFLGKEEISQDWETFG